ncbi:MAG: serine/threonine-protein kinase [Myxococcota bacterium]
MARSCQRCGYDNTDEARFCLQCGAMLEVEVAQNSDPLLGKILLGRYRVVQVLGEGGMGKVYLAEQRMGTATRKVAIKTLHPELSTDPQLVARFHRECETVIELHHPNTVQFYDFGDLEDKTLFIVMEFIEGEDLSKRLARGALPLPAIDKILIQVCGSLAEAHTRGVVHRDLKPENVLLTTRGGQTDFVKVLDFGIAKRSEAEDESRAKLTKQGMVLGTPPYMSPEQFSGQTLDLRSDIYSLGIMVYEMVTGRLPFEAKTPWEWATKHLTMQPTPLDAYPQGAALPINKKNAIIRALSKNREERHPDVLSFMHEFTGIQDAQAAWTMATSTGLSGPQQVQRNNPAAPRAPVGTPQPMHSMGSSPSIPHPIPTPTPTGVPLHPVPTPGPTEYPSGTLPGVQPGGGRGWIVAIVILFMLLGGAAGGGFWWWKQQQTTVTTSNPPVLDPQPVTGVTTMATMQPETMVPTMVEPPTMDPIPAMVEMVDPVMVEMVDPVMVEMTEDTEPTMMGMGPSSGDIAAARRLASEAEAAANSGNLNGAISSLRQAQRRVGRSHSSVRRTKNRIATIGSNTVGNLLLRGQCPQAQRLYRQLRGVGAHGPSRGQFGDWCRAP